MTKRRIPRWHAAIHYRAEAGVVDVEHDFEEIKELHDIVERGPDWNTIDQIVVTLARRSSKAMTLEEAKEL